MTYKFWKSERRKCQIKTVYISIGRRFNRILCVNLSGGRSTTRNPVPSLPTPATIIVWIQLLRRFRRGIFFKCSTLFECCLVRVHGRNPIVRFRTRSTLLGGTKDAGPTSKGKTRTYPPRVIYPRDTTDRRTTDPNVRRKSDIVALSGRCVFVGDRFFTRCCFRGFRTDRWRRTREKNRRTRLRISSRGSDVVFRTARRRSRDFFHVVFIVLVVEKRSRAPTPVTTTASENV